MNKKLILFVITILASLCLSLFSACALFGDFGGGGGENTDVTNPPDDDTDVSNLKAPEWIRYDAFRDEVYVPDCSESGVTYYQIIQEYDGTSRTLGLLDTATTQPPKTEDGCYVFDVRSMTRVTSFKLTVMCKAKASASVGVSKSFDFVEGEGIIYDKAHCTFDSETGVFTWTKVDGVVGYKAGGTFVTEPKFTVADSISSFSVIPIYDDNRIGVPTEIIVSGVRMSPSYNKETAMFFWDDVADSYILEITDGDETHTYELTETELYYMPDSTYIEVKLTTISALRRPYTADGSLSLMDRVKSISVNSTNRRVSWTAPSGAQSYNIKITKSDGTVTFKESTNTYLILDDTDAGTVNIKIQAVGASSWFTSVYASFNINVIPSVQTFAPSLTYDSELEKVNLSFETDPVAVEKYLVSMSPDGEDKEVIEVDGTVGSFSHQMDLEPYRLGEVSVTRVFKGGADGYYCFLSGSPGLDLNKSVMRVAAPVVEPVKKIDGINVSRSFTVKVKIPEELKGRGRLTLNYTYGIGAEQTRYIMSDTELTFSALIYDSTLKAKFTALSLLLDEAALFSDDSLTYVTHLDTPKPTADRQNLSWEEVDGATEYVVEKRGGDGYTTVQTSADNKYAHGITLPSDTVYRVTAATDDPLTFNGYTGDFTVTKLAQTNVTLNSAGTIFVTASSDATVVTFLDGVESAITDANIRAALTNKTTATLEAYCTRENSRSVAYIDSDPVTYTINGIQGIDASDLNLTVDASTGKVAWEEPENAGKVTRLLYRKTAEDDEYELYSEHTEAATELDGNALPYGDYELAVKPASYRDGYNIYLYYGDTAADTFRKDGIISVGLLEDGMGFSVEFDLTNPDGTASWMLSESGYVSRNYSFDMGSAINAAQNADFLNILNYNGTRNFVLAVVYGDGADAALSASKTLKAGNYPIRFTLKESKVSYTGSYEYVERANNNAPVMIKVKLTPSATDTLSAVESYYVYYYLNSNTDPIIYDNTTEIVVAASSARVPQYFYLGKKSNKFTEENGEFIYYWSKTPSGTRDFYTVALQPTINPSVTVTGAKNNGAQTYFSLKIAVLSFSGYQSQEAFNLEYYSDNGTWDKFTFNYLNSSNQLVTRNDFYFGNDNTAKLDCYQTGTLTITSGKQIRLRIRWAENTYDGTKYDASDWSYYTITVPTITQ